MLLKSNINKNYDWLIVGLGNPGKKYEGNRHNIGYMVAAALCEKHKTEIKKFNSILYNSEIKIAQNQVFVAFPTTYMNNSGEAVRKLAAKFGFAPDKIVLIVDEYNFELGKIHIRQGGSAGGHNGVQSVIEELNAQNFFRLRCGIGKNFPPGGMVDYVLADFNADEIELRNAMIQKAVTALEYLFCNNKDKAMSFINSEKIFEKEVAIKQESPILK